MIWILFLAHLAASISSNNSTGVANLLAQDEEWVPRALFRVGSEPRMQVTPTQLNGHNLPGERRPLKLTQGIVFKDLGEIIVSGNYWTLVIQTKLNIYHREMKNVEASINEYKQSLQTLSLVNRNFNVDIVSEVFGRIVQSHLTSVDRFLDHYTTTSNNLRNLEIALRADQAGPVRVDQPQHTTPPSDILTRETQFLVGRHR